MTNDSYKNKHIHIITYNLLMVLLPVAELTCMMFTGWANITIVMRMCYGSIIVEVCVVCVGVCLWVQWQQSVWPQWRGRAQMPGLTAVVVRISCAVWLPCACTLFACRRFGYVYLRLELMDWIRGFSLAVLVAMVCVNVCVRVCRPCARRG